MSVETLREWILQFLTDAKESGINDSWRTRNMAFLGYVLAQPDYGRSLMTPQKSAAHPAEFIEIEVLRLVNEGLVETKYPGDLGANPFRLFDAGSCSPRPTAVDSSKWTGLPREGVLSDEQAQTLRIALLKVECAIQLSDGTNEEKASARAYAIAINALADSPSPPADLIWQLLARANSFAGIASLFVSILALFQAVSH